MRFQFSLLLLLWSTAAFTQYYEVGTFVGVSNYNGDLNYQSPLIPSEYNPAIGIFGRYNFTRNFSSKISLTKGQISGTDASSLQPDRQMRNLSFRADVVELAATAELNLLPYAIREGKISAPYVFAGIAGFYFNPQAQMRGNWYDLQPLGTEGQGRIEGIPRYSKYQVSFPMGIGFKFNLNHKVNIGVEIGARKTFTDYLDDVSGYYPDIESLKIADPIAAALSFRTPEINPQPLENPAGTMRGNPNDQDWYFFMGMTLSVNMTDKYGLDFDEKYDIFKTVPEKEKPKNRKRKKRRK